jgi:hypothetical protein
MSKIVGLYDNMAITAVSEIGTETMMSLHEIKNTLAYLEQQARLHGYTFSAHLIGVAEAALDEEIALSQPAGLSVATN